MRKSTQKILFLWYLPGAVLALLFVCSTAQGRHLITTGAPAPAFSLPDTKGNLWSLKKLKGKVVVIVFVRPGQERSLQALRALSVLRAQVKQPRWYLLAVVSGEFSAGDREAFFKKVSYAGVVLLDPSMSVYGSYGAIVTPSCVVVDRHGKVAFSKAGYDFEFGALLEAYLKWCLGLVSEAQRDAAIEQVRTGVARHGRVARLLGLARSLRARGKIAEAEQAARRVLSEDPTSLEGRIELAEILLGQKKSEEALALLAGAPKGAERSGPYHLVRGKAQMALGRLERAEADFKTAVALDPHSGIAHYELGKLYEMRGDKDRAIAELKLAFEKLISAEY